MVMLQEKIDVGGLTSKPSSMLSRPSLRSPESNRAPRNQVDDISMFAKIEHEQRFVQRRTVDD